MVISVHRVPEQPRTQAQDHDHRIGWLEGIAEQLDRRLDSIEKRIDGVGRAIGELRTELTRRMDSQFRWLLGIQFGIVGLLISVLLKLN